MRFNSPCICGSDSAGAVVKTGTSYRGEHVDVRVCAGCGVGRTFPGLQVADLMLNDYQKEEGFSDHVSHLHRFQRYSREILKKAEKRLRQNGRRHKPRLLDVGCSVGSLLLEARSRGFIVSGLEVNKAAAEYGCETFGLDIRSCSIEELASDRARFDVITMTQVLEHLEHPAESMSALVNLLEPGGVVIVEVPNYRGLWARLLGAAWPSWGITQHLWHFTPETIPVVAKYASGVRLLEVTANRCVDYYTVLPEALGPLVNLPGRLLNSGDNLIAVFDRADGTRDASF